MGFLDLIKSRNSELEFMLDFDLIQDTSNKIHMKQLAIQTCINMIDKKEFLAGKKMETKRVSYSNMFDVASAADKLRAAGIFNGNELREALGAERVEGDDMLDKYVITKNYQ
ncbi:hypothetical protein [Bacillus sp. B4EP4a]|uniref:hypothetical protein n=1 Tax=Bacillus sp. B4EP4a TaxID=2590665 RepID=UPI001153772A|nr:hypothetical protein [Bacillus sp. B4EP4a]